MSSAATAGSAAPHEAQKRDPEATSAPHDGQVVIATRIGAGTGSMSVRGD
jgi:hypothetical protein